jgi:hypothetical protein
MEVGLMPAGNGDPVAGLNAPEVASMVNTEASLELEYATYANFPVGSATTEKTPWPAEKGDPGSGLSSPVIALMVNAETSLEMLFTT